jgi:hypothetical protein
MVAPDHPAAAAAPELSSFITNLGRDIMYQINKLHSELASIGRTGEHLFRSVEVDVSPWTALFPDAELSMIFSRPDGEIYPVTPTLTNDVLTWSPTSTDLAVSGRGSIEIRLESNGVLGKSAILHTKTESALGAMGDVPAPPDPDWLAAGKEAAAASAETAASAAETATNAAADAAQFAQASESSADQLLLKSDIKGTTQYMTADVDGNVTLIEHKNASEVTIRTDSFDYNTPNLITETRTIVASGNTLIYKYHIDTLEIEVI